MEVREQDLAFAQQRGFFRLRFFDFYDEIRLGENGFVSVANFRVGFGVIDIGIAAACARAVLNAIVRFEYPPLLVLSAETNFDEEVRAVVSLIVDGLRPERTEAAS